MTPPAGAEYPLIRVDKRIPDGSIWQTRWGYVLPPVAGWTRTYEPAGTRWSNPFGGWATKGNGISLFHPTCHFTIAHFGPTDPKRFYIDIAHRFRIDAELIEFVDLFLDVMIEPSGAVSEKDEHQLIFLPAEQRHLARAARDEVRHLIAANNPLFDPRGPFYVLPDDALSLPPSTLATDTR
ncbi:MAG TPA: DUF402 domain-containing protein [Candidatus Limnocylindria bacterium]|nr:DUF402 domain-containing protein [Candidatus Limnocylindria bacterium]